MKMNDDITAVILAGGKSSRMGTDKGLMEFNGKPMISYVIDLLSEFFTKKIIVANNIEYSKFNLPVISDEIPGSGPAGGIYTGLLHSVTSWNFVVACDLPYLSKEVINLLLTAEKNVNAIVPCHHSNPEPLCAMYNKSCLDAFHKNILEGKFKISDVYENLIVNKLTVPPAFFEIKNPFKNLNAKEDIQGE